MSVEEKTCIGGERDFAAISKKIVLDFLKANKDAEQGKYSHKPKGFKYQGVILYNSDISTLNLLREQVSSQLGLDFFVLVCPQLCNTLEHSENGLYPIDIDAFE